MSPNRLAIMLLLLIPACSQPPKISEAEEGQKVEPKTQAEKHIVESGSEPWSAPEYSDVKPDGAVTLVAGEPISEAWFEECDEYVRQQIVEGKFIISDISGRLVVGVKDESGKFTTWPGARVLEGDDDIFYPLQSEEMSAPVDTISF